MPATATSTPPRQRVGCQVIMGVLSFCVFGKSDHRFYKAAGVDPDGASVATRSLTVAAAIGPPSDAAARRPHARATTARTTVWKIAKVVAAVTAAVPGKLIVTMTRLTPTLRTAVAMAMAVRVSRAAPPSSHPAARPAATRADIPATALTGM